MLRCDTAARFCILMEAEMNRLYETFIHRRSILITVADSILSLLPEGILIHMQPSLARTMD